MHDKRLNAYNNDLLPYDYPHEPLYGFPTVRATQTIPKRLIPFNHVLSDKHPDKEAFVHFFVDDYQFERVWRSPQRYLPVLKHYGGVIAPDFSMYLDMPIAMQIWNCYRNRVLAAYFTVNGIEVVPTIAWSDKNSQDWCFSGLPKCSTYAIETNGSMKNSQTRYSLMQGLARARDIVKPSALLVYGRAPKGITYLCEKVDFYKSYSQILHKRL